MKLITINNNSNKRKKNKPIQTKRKKETTNLNYEETTLFIMQRKYHVH